MSCETKKNHDRIPYIILKKFVSLLLILAMLLSSTALAFSADLVENFTKLKTYTDGMFNDVKSYNWFSDNVATAYELGFMIGVGRNNFSPTRYLTVAECITMAARIHSIYYTGSEDFTQGKPWYKVYVNYAIKNGIITSAQFSNYEVAITRRDFVAVLANSIGSKDLEEINTVEDDVIPDVASSSNYYDAIYMFYRTGILTGRDSDGSFIPNDKITRAEGAAIASRIIDKDLREYVRLTHNWGPGTVVKKATCQSEGKIKYSCQDDDCDAVKYESIPKTDHNVDSDGYCTDCGEKIEDIGMTDEEETLAASVKYLGDISVQRSDETTLSLFFSLKDKSKQRIAAPCMVSIKIEDINGVVLYSKTKSVKTSDFSLYKHELYGERKLACVEISSDDFNLTNYNLGTIYMTVYNGDYFNFEKQSIDVDALYVNERVKSQGSDITAD